MKSKSNEGRLIVADFCDDIRQEVGNKFSLMGCYGGPDLQIHPIPGTLPKLCASIQIITPKERPFVSLTVRALLNEDVIAELEIPMDQLSIGLEERLANDHPDRKRLSLRFQMGFSPLTILEPSNLQIVAETEEGLIKGPILSIKGRPESESVSVADL